MLVSTRFQVLFHSPPGVLFTFPSRYCSAIGHLTYLGLDGGPPDFPRRFLVSRGTLDLRPLKSVSSTGLSPSIAGLPMPFDYRSFAFRASVTPQAFLPAVWPPPRSLATTCGISVDFSYSAYLDVSVRQLTPVRLFIQLTVRGHYPAWVSPFGFLRINACLRLPVAFRSLPRPSSASSAKASTLRSFLLDLLAFGSLSAP